MSPLGGTRAVAGSCQERSSWEQGTTPGSGAHCALGREEVVPRALCKSLGLWATVSSLVLVLFGLDYL